MKTEKLSEKSYFLEKNVLLLMCNIEFIQTQILTRLCVAFKFKLKESPQSKYVHQQNKIKLL